MSYFIDNKKFFNLEPNHGGMRECQLGAIWALKSYLTTSSNDIAALISMPTGSGKTALMMATCFVLNIRKVLIIVPSKILRRQICKQFQSLEILKEIGCLDARAGAVSVYEVLNRISKEEEWDEIIQNHDVIVAHPNSISPYYKGVAPVPKALIDSVFVDEAHHEPAPTWQAINKYYDDHLKVFFTATPFRRDRKRMKAKLIYHYSLRKSLDNNILRPIEFVGENSGIISENSDQSLINTAVDIYRLEKERNENATIIIRTDKIESAKRLLFLYNEAGFNVDVVHSKRSPSINEEIINKVSANELDGLVCVGIASEGLDLPNLKVAVLHATPRSIPYTIQFLGRISRSSVSQSGSAKLIANRDLVRGEVRRLYKSDEAWCDLIPNTIDEQMRLARHYRSSQAIEDDFQMPEINVYFSALIYSTSDFFEFESSFTTNNSDFEIIHVEQDSNTSPLIIVTSQKKPLDWSSREIYIEDYLDIHIYYHSSEHNLLFELTTSDKALDSFKKNLIHEELQSISHGRLFKTLADFSQSDYIMVGMKNSALTGASHPSYKTFIGSSVQAAIRNSEGRIFGTGHAVLRLDNENTWGIATRTGRAWSMKRGTAEEFKDWCDQLCNLIENGPIISNLPGLSFLASSEVATSIDEIPIAIIPDDIFFKSYNVIFNIGSNDPIRNILPKIYGIELNESKTILSGRILLRDNYFNFTFDLTNNKHWSIENGTSILVYAERREETVVEKNIEEIFNEYPPSIVLPNGSLIVGINKITPNISVEELPNKMWKAQDWSGCNHRAEAYQENPQGELPVINKTLELLQVNTNSDLVILDDGAHEIADLVYFEHDSSTIHFIHCKFSSGDAPGCRKNDCDELFAQAMRSIHWISSPILLDRLNYRITSRNNSMILVGSEEILSTISENYRVNNWNFNIILAQPGFKIENVSNRDRQNNNVYELAIPMYERVIGSNCTIEIWGS